MLLWSYKKLGLRLLAVLRLLVVRWQFFNDGLQQLRMNPLRIGLSILGMIFGVGSLIAMNAIGGGAQREIVTLIESIGKDLVHVVPSELKDDTLREVVKQSAGLSSNDLYSISQLFPNLPIAYRSAAPASSLMFTHKISSEGVSLLGVSENYFALHNLLPLAGRPLLESDHHTLRRTIVIGYELARRLLQNSDHDFAYLLGNFLRVDQAFFEIVGVLKEHRQDGAQVLGKTDYNHSIFMPYATMSQEVKAPASYNELDLISVKISDLEKTLSAKNQLQPLLTLLHGSQDDFKIIAPLEILQQRSKAQHLLNLVFGIIATISLVVGGIGIMNMMIASVTERTREIGLRRALGATQGDIARMFLNESLFISFVGGGLGILFGVGASLIASFAIAIPIDFSVEAVLFAFATASTIGVVFGIFPARRAAKLA
jgi:putative ABC transport system permease protein